jgi:hypothetical protein
LPPQRADTGCEAESGAARESRELRDPVFVRPHAQGKLADP